MEITLLPLLCNLSYGMQFLPSFLNGVGGNKFLNKIKRWRLNNCCNAGGCWGKCDLHGNYVMAVTMLSLCTFIIYREKEIGFIAKFFSKYFFRPKVIPNYMPS